MWSQSSDSWEFLIYLTIFFLLLKQNKQIRKQTKKPLQKPLFRAQPGFQAPPLVERACSFGFPVQPPWAPEDRRAALPAPFPPAPRSVRSAPPAPLSLSGRLPSSLSSVPRLSQPVCDCSCALSWVSPRAPVSWSASLVGLLGSPLSPPYSSGLQVRGEGNALTKPWSKWPVSEGQGRDSSPNSGVPGGEGTPASPPLPSKPGTPTGLMCRSEAVCGLSWELWFWRPV